MRAYWLIPIAAAICLTSAAGAEKGLKGKKPKAKVNNRQFMVPTNTPTSGVAGTKKGSSPCVDLNEYCPAWAKKGECQNNPNGMLFSCRKSCNQCSSGEILAQEIKILKQNNLQLQAEIAKLFQLIQSQPQQTVAVTQLQREIAQLKLLIQSQAQQPGVIAAKLQKEIDKLTKLIQSQGNKTETNAFMVTRATQHSLKHKLGNGGAGPPPATCQTAVCAQQIKFEHVDLDTGNRWDNSRGVYKCSGTNAHYFFIFHYLADYNTETRASLKVGGTFQQNCAAITNGQKYTHGTFSCVVSCNDGDEVGVYLFDGILNEPPASWGRSYTIFSGFRLN